MKGMTNTSLYQINADLADLIRREFADLKTSFKNEHVADVLKPITECFDTITAAVNKTAQKAEKGLEISSALQSEIKIPPLWERTFYMSAW